MFLTINRVYNRVFLLEIYQIKKCKSLIISFYFGRNQTHNPKVTGSSPVPATK